MKYLRIIPIILAMTALNGCGSGLMVAHRHNVFAMDTYMNLMTYEEGADEAFELAEKEIKRLDALMSVTKSDSDIGRVNSANGASVEVSDETALIIAAGLEYGKLTDGALDISIYPVLEEWGFTKEEQDGQIPPEGIISERLKNVGCENISLDGNNVTIPPEYKIDLGALAKGYTSDVVIDLLREEGVTSAIVSLGGNVKALGLRPDGSPWNVAVRSPFNEEYIGYLDIGEKAVVTSGGYERFFAGPDGNIYHHIIDPKDGYPANNGLASVTVIADSGLMCDALSTALFVAGTDKALELWKSRDDFEMILVTDDERIICTGDIAPHFRNSSDMEVEVVERD